MFIIPIGTGKQITVWPVITICLIAMNLLVFLISSQVLHRQFEQIEWLRQRMWEIEKQYLGDNPYNHYQFKTLEELEERDQIILNGEIIPSGSADFQIWNGLFQEFKYRIDHYIFRQWGFVPAQFNFSKIFSSIFLHGGWMHLIGNMLFLWLAGAVLEQEIGWRKFLVMYLVFGFAAALFYYSLDPGSQAPCIGASGAIAGLMGAFLIRFYKTKIVFLLFILLFVRVFTRKFRVPAYICIPLWFLNQLFSAKLGPDVGVAFGAHIGGFVAGAFMIIVLQSAEWLPPANPEGDEEDFMKASLKKVQNLKNREEFIRHATTNDLETLLAIVRVEPENSAAMMALARIQFESGAVKDSSVSYNRALDMALSSQDAENTTLIYTAIKRRELMKSLTRENILRLEKHFESLQEFEDAVRLMLLFIMKFPQDPERPKMIYKAYKIYKTHLQDMNRARKAAQLLKREYPHLLKGAAP
jgi:membrane associated rhomboid family serine protease